MLLVLFNKMPAVVLRRNNSKQLKLKIWESWVCNWAGGQGTDQGYVMLEQGPLSVIALLFTIGYPGGILKWH